MVPFSHVFLERARFLQGFKLTIVKRWFISHELLERHLRQAVLIHVGGRDFEHTVACLGAQIELANRLIAHQVNDIDLVVLSVSSASKLTLVLGQKDGIMVVAFDGDLLPGKLSPIAFDHNRA